MGINVFPPASGAEGGNFVVDINDTTNNVATLDSPKGAGTYNISLDSGDTTFDIYLIDSNGNSVGYSNSASITASAAFEQVAVLGVASSEIISFSFAGAISNASSAGSATGAGAYLESITPTDLSTIDDSATVTGGNFATDVEIDFISGETVLPAKSIIRNSSTELIVTRPDGLIEDLSPFDLRATNPGVLPPSGSNSHILTDSVTAGSDPTWVTTSPLNQAQVGTFFTQTLEATDVEGQVVDYSITSGSIDPGLTLDASTGILSGTPTTGGNFTFTVTATDDGGNTTDKQFEHTAILAEGGTVVDDGGYRYHTFQSTDDFVVHSPISTLEYLAIAGGGGGGTGNTNVAAEGGGGGGAGGLKNSSLSSIPAGTYTMSVGAGGSAFSKGSDSSIDAFVSVTGGGRGAGFLFNGSNVNTTNGVGGDGGSGGGGGTVGAGNGIPGQGFDGGVGTTLSRGSGGGGAASPANNATNNNPSPGGAGLQLTEWATATSTGVSGGYYGGGGGGGAREDGGASGGIGGGGTGGYNTGSPFYGTVTGNAGTSGTGGGGGGGATSNDKSTAGMPGGSGLVIVRYAF